MTTSNSNKTAVVITGATAVGKTELTIKLAQHYKTAIISADSRQFYKELNIGTAKPTKEELERAPHYFIGHLSIHDYYNVSMYEQDALKCITALFNKHDVVFITGGSGLYIDAFCKGIDDLPDPTPEIRKELKQTYDTQGIEALRFMLKRYDPVYYETADLANPKRLMRALEVCLITGEKYSDLRTNIKKERPFQIISIALDRPRQELFERINTRVEMMLEEGLLDEAKSLYKYKHLNALNTVGYKELFDYFDAKISLERAIENIKTNTRRYAKRQLTWFKKDKNIIWAHPNDDIIKLLTLKRLEATGN